MYSDTYSIRPALPWTGRMAKDMVDYVVAATLLVVLAPIMLAIAALVATTSPGPVLYKQSRLGRGHQFIEVWKFRTMHREACLKPAIHATRDDPRVTTLGRILRRTSLDELPQLFNVLRGEMSLVGPRPHAIPHDLYYAGLIPGYFGRLRVKPGMTGWAQINGLRGEIKDLEQMRQRVDHDLFYITHWSLALDVKILLRTATVFFGQREAY